MYSFCHYKTNSQKGVRLSEVAKKFEIFRKVQVIVQVAHEGASFVNIRGTFE